ncbi:hypothetical protein [Butyrivibrio sp. VCB2006]|uniref:hypothetical protein n=1 Tax=Butyrivibrio sp. VCB2006 TaxID=1280679 RepID=UPI00041B9B12|nr:hypothetical protein [Butyrivibrio sp. VCB2006]
MLKKIMEKHLFRVITIIVLLCVGSVGYVTAKERKAWSAEVSEPGMGLPHDQAVRVQELIDSGMSFSEAYAIMLGEYNVPVEYDTPSASTNANTQTETKSAPSTEAAPSTSNTEKSESKTEPKTETKPAKVYAHDFDAITDEAKDNFIHFSEDGTPDSMYLNIRAESAMNTITGRELNATTSGNEVGTINYVDAEGNVLHSWVFENWKSDDDFYLDLSAYLEPYTSEELVAAYKLSLQDVTLPEGNTVVLKVQSPYADGTIVNIFTEETGELKETGKTLTVSDGYITFEFTDAISTPVMSPETLIAVNTSEEKEDLSKDAVAAEAAPAEAVNEAVLEVETPDPALSTNTENVQKNNTKYIIGIICAVLVVSAGVFVVNNKKRAKAA